MDKINRRKFLSGVGAGFTLPLFYAAKASANGQIFRLILPENKDVYSFGDPILLRVLTKTAFPRLSVVFKANGQTIGTAASFPYQISWMPGRTGDYTITAEISAPQTKVVVKTVVKVYRLLYDGIGTPTNRLYNLENYYSSYQSTAIPEANSYGFPLNHIWGVNTARSIRQIELLLSSTTRLFNDWRNLPFPQFNYVMARLWNDGPIGFANSPLGGNLGNFNLGAPVFGSTSEPFALDSQGIKYFLTGWENLNIPIPANLRIGLSLQFSIDSLNDFTERINIASSIITIQDLLYASGQLNPPTTNISPIGASALRIWTD
ncbi:MAG TPA: Ig-like domain-containing protein [Pyrinomonadaceae bacterium]|nr:Ig-like domain-containing protein [Pyrinomonadaceae bacterium]